MVPLTRRDLLQGAAGLTAALAGCSGLFDGSAESTRTAPREEPDGGPASGSSTDPATLLIRVDTDRPPLWLSETDGSDGGRPTPSERDRWRDTILVDDAARADRLAVARVVDRDRVASFIGATDFSAETVYVEMQEVGECFRLDLCYVSWTPTEIATDYTRRSRPYTERCAVDGMVIEARLIRIPDALEADDVTGYAASVGTGGCHSRRASGDGTGGSGPATTGEGTPTPTEAGGDQ